MGRVKSSVLRWLGRCLLCGVGVGVGILAAEGVTRRLIGRRVYIQPGRPEDVYYGKDIHGVRHHIPGKVGSQRSWNGMGRVSIRINQFGFRGPEIVVPKPRDVFRVLFIGDSVTLSGCTREEDTFVHLVSVLQPTWRGKTVETVNGGVGDVGIREELIYLQKGLEIDPDLVVWVWYLNDARPPQGFPEEVVESSLLLSGLRRLPGFQRSVVLGWLYETAREKYLRKAVLSSEDLSRRFAWAEMFNAGDWKTSPEEFARLITAARFDWGDAWNEDSLEWTIDQLRSVHAKLQRRGVPLMVVATPVLPQVGVRGRNEWLRWPQNTLGRTLKKAGVPFLDLIDPLRKASVSSFFDQCHFTPDGSRIVGQAVASFIFQTRSVDSKKKFDS